MLSIILNIITILILIFVLTLFLRLYYKQKNKPEKTSGDSKSATNNDEVTASEVMKNTFDDPLVTSRSYFTESSYGEIGDFMGQQTHSSVYWIEGKPIQV